MILIILGWARGWTRLFFTTLHPMVAPLFLSLSLSIIVTIHRPRTTTISSLSSILFSTPRVNREKRASGYGYIRQSWSWQETETIPMSKLDRSITRKPIKRIDTITVNIIRIRKISSFSSSSYYYSSVFLFRSFNGTTSRRPF